MATRKTPQHRAPNGQWAKNPIPTLTDEVSPSLVGLSAESPRMPFWWRFWLFLSGKS